MGQKALQPYERAVVIGGSMAGLAVARALSERFREVVVIEPDKLNLERPEHRAGVPQSWHLHALVLRGQFELETLFPGFIETALQLGAVRFDHAADLVAYTNYGWKPRYESEFIALSATRILFEFAERRRFFALTKNATLLDNTRALNLLTESRDGRHRAVGVVTDHPTHTRVLANLVVDCSGRASRWKTWFARHGVALPRESVVNAHCGYSSRLYRPRNAGEFPWKAMVCDTVYPARPHFGAIIPIENGEWMVTLGGFNGAYPPSDERGFEEFARRLPTPLPSAALLRADALSKVRSFRRHEMHWNHFEAFAHPISHYIVVGDSAWSFNPHYGQGMSIAVGCARILRDVLRQSGELESLPHRYYARAKKFAWPQWNGTAQLDLRWSGTQGAKAWHSRISHPLAELVVRAGQHDRVVSRALLEGGHFLKTPGQVMRPNVLLRAAVFGLKQLGPGRACVANELPAAPGRHAVKPPLAAAVEGPQLARGVAASGNGKRDLHAVNQR